MGHVEHAVGPIQFGGQGGSNGMTAASPGRELAWLVPLLCVAVCGIGAVDVLTGAEIAITAFYVPIVVVAAWRSGKVGAICCAVGCAATGILADHLVSAPLWQLSTSYTSARIPWLNGAARLFVYLVVGLVVAWLFEIIRQRDRALRELQEALSQVRTLEGLLPICAWCKKIRDDQDEGRWMAVEQYVAKHTSAQFTHGICPSCVRAVAAESAR
jgi:hypothetical protein